MSLIGNDLIPNTYIDKIDVYEGAFEASIYCVDSVESPVWSDHALSMKYFKFMVVSTENSSLINSFEFGYIKMDPKDILKEDPNAKISFYPIRGTMRVFNNGFNNFKIKVKHKFHNSTRLNLYAAVVVDPVQIAGPKFVKEKFINGPVASEKIFSGGEISTEMSVWTLPDGKQWIGPVHRHPTKGFMQFSSHSDVEHQTVSLKTIKNIKIKDLRTKISYASSLTSIKNDITEVSALFNSFDSMGQNNSIFFLNMKQIVAKNTKFGNVFLSLEPKYYKKIINNLNFRLIKIERQMVRTSFVNNRIKINKILETKKVLSAFQTGDIFTTTFGNGIIRKTIFPFNDLVSAFEFSDLDANVNLPGQFQYNVTVFFNDPTIRESNLIIKELNEASQIINKYLGRIKRNLKTNEEKNNPPEEWISIETSLHEDNLNLAPWILVPKIYAKYKKMFFDLEDDINKLEFDGHSMLNPRSFSMNSINKFKSNLNVVISHVNKAFNTRTAPISNYSDLSMPKNSYISNLVEKKFHFNNIIEPSLNKKFYNVLEETPGQQFTKRVSLPTFKNRMAIEHSKFFIQGNQEGNSIETNLNISMASYFSPFSISDPNGNKINLTNLNNIDKEKFNAFFDNIPKRRYRTPRRPSVRSKIAILPMQFLAEGEEDFIEAKEYLGADSTFISSDSEEIYKKVKPASKKTIKNISNKVTSRKTKAKGRVSIKATNNIFTPAAISRAPSTLSGKTLIPNQFRSYNNDLVPSSRDIFSEEEMKEAENDLLIAVNYLTLVQIETLTSFATNSDGVMVMHNPTWELVTTEQLNDLSSGALCRMEQIKSPISNFETDDRVDLSFSDSFFIIADADLPFNNATEEVEEESNLLSSFESSIAFDIAGATSEVIEQNVSTESEIFKVKIEEFKIENQPATTTTNRRSISRPGTKTSRGGY